MTDTLSGEIKNKWIGDIFQAGSSRVAIRYNAKLYGEIARGVILRDDNGKSEA